MYLYYCLTALTVIILAALFLYIFMKRRNLLDKKNKVNLLVCTVLAMVCAIFTPLLAKLMVQKLYFSIFISVVLSLIICITLGWLAFSYLKNTIKQEEVKEQINPEEGMALEGISPVEEKVDQEVTPVDEVEAVPTIITEVQDADVPTLSELLDEASACKNNHELNKAIFLYEAALLQNPDPELSQWIIIDLCSLYKVTNQKELIYKALESEYSNLLNNHIKEDILRNI